MTINIEEEKDRPKRLLFLSNVIPYFFPVRSKQFGGVSRQYRVIRELAKEADYQLICLVDSRNRIPINERKGITFVKSRLGRLFGLVDLYRQCNMLDVDMVIEFCASLQVVVLGWLRSIKGLRFVFFVDNDTDVDGRYASRTNKFYERLYQWGLKQADAIICQTEEQRCMLKKTYGLEGEVVLSPYIEITSALQKERDYILWVGRAAIQKRPDRFLWLAKLMPDEKFVMIFNPGNNELFNSIKRQVESLDNVMFIDAIIPSKMREIYARAKFLINTSDFEGFPNTFLEAAMEETPVVSFKVNPNGMFTNYGAGIVCHGSIDSFVQNCRNLAEKCKMIEHLGEKARAYAVEHHGIDGAIIEIRKIFNRVLN